MISRKIHFCGLLLSVLALTACGGSGNSSSAASPAPVLIPSATPSVSISSSAQAVPLNSQFTLTWSSTNASSCVASGDWSGNIATSGTFVAQKNNVGSANYIITCGTASNSVAVKILDQFTSIPDPVFADALKRLGYSVTDNKMLTSDALSIKNLCISSANESTYGPTDSSGTVTLNNNSIPDNGVKCVYTPAGRYITDTTGLEAMVNILTFRIEFQRFTSINIKTLDRLELFSLWGNPIQSIDLSQNRNLKIVGLYQTSLRELDLSGLTKLVELGADNGITGFDSEESHHPFTLRNGTIVTGLTSVKLPRSDTLRMVGLSDNQLTDVDFSGTPNIVQMGLKGNKFTKLDLSNLKKLNYFAAGDRYLTSLNLTGLIGPFYRLYVACSPYLQTIRVNDPGVIIGGGYSYLTLPLTGGKGPCGKPEKGIGSPTSSNGVFVDANMIFTN